MILSFKPQFEQPILQGLKIHTLRDDLHDRWHAGMKIHMATGVRTPRYRCFREGVCKSTQRVEISVYSSYSHFSLDDLGVCIDCKELTNDEVELLAKNDGFNTVLDMVKWFFPKSCSGYRKLKLIHWTDLKY